MTRVSEFICTVLATLIAVCEWALFFYLIKSSGFHPGAFLIVAGIVLIALTVVWAEIIIGQIKAAIFNKEDEHDDLS